MSESLVVAVIVTRKCECKSRCYMSREVKVVCIMWCPKRFGGKTCGRVSLNKVYGANLFLGSVRMYGC